MATCTNFAYNSEQSAFDSLLDAVLQVSSLQGGIDTDARRRIGVKLYTRITVASVTLYRLTPGNRLIYREAFAWWDWPSVAAVTRNILEAYLNFHYIAVEPLGPEEDEFRQRVFWYHDNIEKYKLYKSWNAPQDVLKDFEIKLSNEKAWLENHVTASNLTNAQRKSALSGKHPCYLSREVILSRLPFGTDEVQGYYRMFSANVHAAPFSWQRNDNDRGRGEENKVEKEYIRMALNFARKYIAASVIEMCQLFPDHIQAKASEAYNSALRHFHAVQKVAYPSR